MTTSKSSANKQNNGAEPVCLFQWLMLLCMTLLLLGCGGDEELADHQIEVTNSAGVTLTVTALRASDDVGTRQLSLAEPLSLQVSLVDAGEDPLSGVLITMESDLVTFDPESGTALTGSNGRTAITAEAQEILGAGGITITAATDSGTLTAVMNVEVLSTTIDVSEGSDAELDIALSLVSSAGNAVVRADAEGVLTVTVTDGDGVPQANELVVLTVTEDLSTLGTANSILLTNSDGEATTKVTASDTFGAGTLTATVTRGTLEATASINFVVTEPALRLGASSGDAFISETLAINVESLSAGGTTSVTANVVNEQGDLFTAPVTVEFSSTCVESTLATIDTSVTTVHGSARATYQAAGCQGTDTITAVATFGGATFSASGTLDVLSDTVGAIEFLDADPTQVSLLGTGAQGLSETSTVSFRVRGEQGLPFANQSVDFALTTAVGGITLSPASALSDSDGIVSTVVQAGSISSSVGVIAQVTGTKISTQSDLLAITTGIPDQNSMTIARSTCAPEALVHFNEEVTFTAGVADAFNNPVPDGTAVTFRTEGGVIEGVCTTVDGLCAVTWSSQQPEPSDGRVTVMATAIGHESFDDENGNGVFDEDDLFTDLSEAFLDADQDDERDIGEPYIDFDEDGDFDIGDGKYNGVLCQHPTLCGEETSVSVRADQEIVIAGSTAVIIFTTGGQTFQPGEPVTLDASGGSVNVTVTIEDINGNSMPTGSEVTFTTDNGELLGLDTHVIPCTLNSSSFNLSIAADEESDSNIFSVTVTTPKDIVTTRSATVID